MGIELGLLRTAILSLYPNPQTVAMTGMDIEVGSNRRSLLRWFTTCASIVRVL
ncbi:MAG: hypothetical protein NW701_17690 [Nitrospira sp.]